MFLMVFPYSSLKLAYVSLQVYKIHDGNKYFPLSQFCSFYKHISRDIRSWERCTSFIFTTPILFMLVRLVLQVSSSRTKAGQKGKVISAKLSARSDGSGKGTLGSNVPMGLAPPMSSVIVERHQPITKVMNSQQGAYQGLEMF